MREKLNYHLTLPDSGEFSGTLYGGEGVDEILAGNRVNAWDISGDDVGTITGLSTTLNEIERLTGNDNNDDFTLLAAGSISRPIPPALLMAVPVATASTLTPRV